MLDEGEPEDEYGPKGKADAPPPLDPDPDPPALGPCWPPLPETCWLEPVAPEPDVTC